VPVDYIPGVWGSPESIGEVPELVALQAWRVRRGIPATCVLLCGNDQGGICLDYSVAAGEPQVVFWQASRPALLIAKDFATFLAGLCNMEHLKVRVCCRQEGCTVCHAQFFCARPKKGLRQRPRCGCG
jgi:hypothetical protein